MAVSKRTRFEVLRRDGYACRYCGRRAPDVQLVVDHVIPTALGGTDDLSNLVAACSDCNSGKTSTSPDPSTVAEVRDDALRWAAAMRVAVDNWFAVRADGWEYGNVIATAWDNGNAVSRGGRAWLPDDWTDTVDRWRLLGVPAELVADAVGQAMRRRSVQSESVWRYTCGIVWRQVEQLQQDALQYVDDTQPAAGGQDDAWVKGFDDAFLVPLVHPAWIQARALSRVVDGVAPWNTAPGQDVA